MSAQNANLIRIRRHPHRHAIGRALLGSHQHASGCSRGTGCWLDWFAGFTEACAEVAEGSQNALYVNMIRSQSYPSSKYNCIENSLQYWFPKIPCFKSPNGTNGPKTEQINWFLGCQSTPCITVAGAVATRAQLWIQRLAATKNAPTQPDNTYTVHKKSYRYWYNLIYVHTLLLHAITCTYCVCMSNISVV